MSRKPYSSNGTRASFIDLAAGVLDSLQQRRSALGAQVDDGDLPEEALQRGDFLYDFIRLNANYVNQFARLGSSYSIVAARALERLYDYWQPLEHASDPDVQRFAGRKDARIVVKAPVHNPTDEVAHYTAAVSEFWIEGDDDAPRLFEELEPRYQHPKRSRSQRVEFSLDPDEGEVVRLGLRFATEMVVGAEYYGVLVVTRREIKILQGGRRRDATEFEKEVMRFPIALRRRAG